MTTYLSTFTTGFSDLVRATLKNEIDDIKIDLLLDGLVVYQTDIDQEKILNLQFLNNNFMLFHYQKTKTNKPFAEIKDWIKDSSDFPKQIKSLKYLTDVQLIFVEENQYTHIDKNFKTKLSELITEKTKLPIAKVDGENELWFMTRKEGFVFLAFRLNNDRISDKDLAKGELKPELATLLCLLSEPEVTDTFIDPFAGSGAIPKARLSFPYKVIAASDGNLAVANRLKKNFSDTEIRSYHHDALKLVSLTGDASIKKIVTDPPWGLFGPKLNIGVFYPQMFHEFSEVLQKDGILVLLVSRLIDIEKVLVPFKNKFRLEQKINTLVNGQKAVVYKIRKKV